MTGQVRLRSGAGESMPHYVQEPLSGTQRLMTNRPDPVGPAIRELEPSGITKVTALGLSNPDVLPLWFGETDLVTPPFIRRAAVQALEEGRTFYTNARGILPLREAIRDFHRRTSGAEIGLERITVPGGAMLAV